MQAFRSSATTAQTAYGTVLSVFGSQLRVRVGPSTFTCAVAAPLSLCDVRVGDIVFLIYVQDRPYATAIARPENGLAERTATNVAGNAAGTDIILPVTPPPFNDSHLLRRDGTRTLLAAARWVWEAGSEVAGVFRSWGTGFLQVIGSLYAGRREGGHVGIFEHQTEDAGITSSLIQGVDSDNVPFISFGVKHDDDPNSAWVKIGREEGPSIHFGPLTGQTFNVPLVDVELLNGQIPGSQIDTTTLKIPIVESLEGLNFEEPTLFELRAGADSGVLYMWTRWGPEPIGGYHRAGPHTHGSFEEGDQLSLAVAFSDVAVAAPADDDLLQYDVAAAKWTNVTAAAFMASRVLADLGDVEAIAPAAGNALLWDANASQWSPGVFAPPRTEVQLIMNFGERVP